MARVPAGYRFAATGFTKVTVSLNNPTPAHTDYANIGLTCLLAHDVSGPDERLVRGNHVIFGRSFRSDSSPCGQRRRRVRHRSIPVHTACEFGNHTRLSSAVCVLQQRHVLWDLI
eukprot:1789752-Pleurochrysis_carterae.AAC.1